MSIRLSIAMAVATVAGVATLATSPVRAANIATTLGAPGSAAWVAACAGGPAPAQQPAGTSQLAACPGGGANCLHRVVIDNSEFPEAVCSDGTPGVFYVRPGVGDDASRWVIHLQGGGACRDYDSCLQRWCGEQGNLPYTANKMSSDWNGDGVTDLAAHVWGPGMASANANNRFSTWTHVWAYYCSSDSWQGRAADVTFTSGGSSFDLDARGHTILYAMRKMLRKLNANPTWTAAGHYAVEDLDEATDIVFTGTSAGAKGAIENADWFVSVFPTADTSLVVDANFDGSDNVLSANDIWYDEDVDGDGDMNYYSARIGLANDEWAPGGYSHEIDAFVDESCRDVYEPMGRMDRCSQFSTLLRLDYGPDPLIVTPTFVRLDLSDPVISDTYTDHPNMGGWSLLAGQYGPTTTLQDFREIMRASLVETFDDAGSVSGLYGPRCGQHVGLEEWDPFFVDLTPSTTDGYPVGVLIGSDLSLHDTLWNWLNVGGVGRVRIRRIDTDLAGTVLSSC